MKFELFVALRYLMAKRKQTFISLITWISIGGVALGVTALIVVLAVMTGMQSELRDKILSTYSHIVILKTGGGMTDSKQRLDEVKRHSNVQSASYYIYKDVLVSSRIRSKGAIIRGIDPAMEGTPTGMDKYIKYGSVKSLSEKFNDGEFKRDGIIIGDELAGSLGVNVGQIVTILSPKGRRTAMGIVPKVQKFYITALFHSGMYEYDSGMALISLESAQRFFGMTQRVSGMEIKVNDIYTADATADELAKELGSPFYARDWMEMNRNLFIALKLEKVAIFIILALVVLVASFNIVSTMIMVVMEKGRDIAILKAMGATKKMIMKIFFLEGCIIGISGTLIGNLLGFILCVLLEKYQFIHLPADIYPASTLAVEMSVHDFVFVSASAVAITLLSAIYPAWNGSQVDPAEALRYE